MTISLSDLGKRFNRDWIFRRLTYKFSVGNSYALIGPNGSGKSTLLQVIGGALFFNEGTLQYTNASQQIIKDEWVYQQVSFTAPYLELIEEMTGQELLDFHHSFKPFFTGKNSSSILEEVGLSNAAHKQIRYYSSGMKQRLKLAQSFFCNTSVLLLDEPCTNLDQDGIELYHRLLSLYTKDRIVIIASNDLVEYKFCQQQLLLSDFKGN
ncbi:MAG: ATP-binding cassette domain-containing protein [Bacteroidetes bacterium]|nr:ATP-binding cassette domain-containing protein [Bacteroidota bacterium]